MYPNKPVYLISNGTTGSGAEGYAELSGLRSAVINIKQGKWRGQLI
jgi:hypothetical protein